MDSASLGEKSTVNQDHKQANTPQVTDTDQSPFSAISYLQQSPAMSCSSSLFLSPTPSLLYPLLHAHAHWVPMEPQTEHISAFSKYMLSRTSFAPTGTLYSDVVQMGAVPHTADHSLTLLSPHQKGVTEDTEAIQI